MKQYVETSLGDADILVEVYENIEAFEPDDKMYRALPKKRPTFEDVVNEMKNGASMVFDTLASLGVEEIELSYGLSLGVKGGISFWVLSEINSSANISIKMKWKAKE